VDRYDDFCGDQSVRAFVQSSKSSGHQTPEGAALEYVDQLIQSGRIAEVAEDEGVDPQDLQSEVYDDVLARITPEWGEAHLQGAQDEPRRCLLWGVIIDPSGNGETISPTYPDLHAFDWPAGVHGSPLGYQHPWLVVFRALGTCGAWTREEARRIWRENKDNDR